MYRLGKEPTLYSEYKSVYSKISIEVLTYPSQQLSVVVSYLLHYCSLSSVISVNNVLPKHGINMHKYEIKLNLDFLF